MSFEKGNIFMEDFEKRLIKEKRDLDEKISKLNDFFKSGAQYAVDEIQHSLLGIQLSAMETYSRILNVRLGGLI